MRTTITLDPDVVAALTELQERNGFGLSRAVNELVRRGLMVPSARERFVQTTSSMGEARLPIDDIGGVLDAIDGDSAR